MACGTRIVWVDQFEGWRFPVYAWRDAAIPPLGLFQSEAYVCGELPPHYPVPAPIGLHGFPWDYHMEVGNGTA